MLTYNNFLKILVVFCIASGIVIANTNSTSVVLITILVLGLAIEILCLFRLKSLGYSTNEAIKRLFYYGDKLSVFFNKTKRRVS